jgi:DnaJ-class molecular chaperone
MTDPYETLGVERTASAAEIRAAYRKLAKAHHPDLHPGDKDAEARFKEISAAHELLKDPEKRARFDCGEIDASGAERADRPFYRAYADGESGDGAQYWRHASGEGGGAGGFGAEDLFSELFGRGRAGPGGGQFRMRGQDVTYTLRCAFLDAVNGARRRVTLSDGKTLDVDIPAGTRDRQTLRLKGQGMPGIGGGETGDAYIEIHIEPHAFFTRKDEDIHVELPVTLPEAVLGAKVRAPTVDGHVALTVPPGSNTGDTLRLRGKGVQRPKGGGRGDQYVTLKVVLPDEPDDALKSFLEDWSQTHGYDVRSRAGMA